MRAVSLFSGAGGFETGLDRTGIKTVLQVENNKWCQEVLRRRWPDVERISNVKDVDSSVLELFRDEQHPGMDSHDLRNPSRSSTERYSQPATWSTNHVDLIYGGFPCQDLSVAGKRAGLRQGSRSGLWFEFERIIGELRPRWILIEQVPGLLSSNKGRDFAVMLDALDEFGYGLAWRVLDAQKFSVPQRRRRVFIVGHLGDIRGPSEVLALGESSLGDSETSGQARQEVAGPLGGSSQSGGFRTTDLDNQGAYVAYALTSREHKGVSQRESQSNLIPTVTSKWAKGSGGPAGDEAQNLVPAPTGVRRLTPRECERLMGWPDDHTRWTADGREIADTNRYKLCGNGVVSTVAEWIGHRMVFVDKELNNSE